eukprot:9192346-Alexandrium_andersonii.AAC.1
MGPGEGCSRGGTCGRSGNRMTTRGAFFLVGADKVVGREDIANYLGADDVVDEVQLGAGEIARSFILFAPAEDA